MTSLSTQPSESGLGGLPTRPTGADLIERERGLFREILRLVAERSAAETKIEGARASNQSKAEAEYQRALMALEQKFQRLDEEAKAEDAQRRRSIVDATLAKERESKSEFGSASRRIASEFDALRETTKATYQRDRAAAESSFASGTNAVNQKYAAEIKPVDEAGRAANSIRERIAAVASEYARFGLRTELPPALSEDYSKLGDPVLEMVLRPTRMEAPLKMLEGLVIPRLTQGWGSTCLYVIIIALLAGIGFWLETGAIGILAAAGVGAVLAVLLRTWLVKLSQRQLVQFYTPLTHMLADADGIAAYCRGVATTRFKQASQDLAATKEAALQRAKATHARAISTGEAERDERIRKISEAFAVKTVEIQTDQQRQLREAIETHDRRMSELPIQAAASRKKLDDQLESFKEQVRTRYETAWESMAGAWLGGMRKASAGVDEINRLVDSYNPAWDDPAWEGREAPRLVPPVLRFGSVCLDLATLEHGIPSDPRLMEGVITRYRFPMLRAFPTQANLLVEAPPEGRAEATTVLQTTMFRMLTSLPPGKVRFTILDLSGIGRSFGAFMHLADFDADLITNQVWTDPREIDERLAELTAHMETISQKYLRNEYATIEDYNEAAGEVAEPYRVLVVANFPGKIDEKLAERLAAIAEGGIPCGVLTLLDVDPTRPMPMNVGIDTFRTHAFPIKWDGARLGFPDPDFNAFPMELDPPLPPEFATAQIQKVGSASSVAKRVEVPFTYIAPSEEDFWKSDSRTGIELALGKAGATKRQYLALGKGTSQHVLIAGRTGSGKSTLMHALIINLALNYSPDEVELYLIDFKKGVEFKVYATYELPHAKVVAIESEREFGISVLQRIDAELRLRADMFREVGVQDIHGYRNSRGAPPLPRIMLIVDEFQEFFVEEDKLAQEAAVLLDRLVRQGRAFGIHVILGSQSLGGAFTLARTTLGQMAIRIALQCSEADSLQILSEQNPAARLLSRPGEAIYNDTNGAPDGNHFFQVVWLSDERREAYLKQIQGLNRTHKPVLTRSLIVFEGDTPAVLSRNPLLLRCLESGPGSENPRLAHGWLGEAIAIKDPTSAVFRRQGGNHLLIVGQQEDAAVAVVASVLLSLAAQFPPATSETLRLGARFDVLDGTPEGNPTSGLLGKLAARLPHNVTTGGWRDVPRVLAEMHAELLRRKQAEGDDGPERFLFIHDLPNFRDLRRKEDDFSFSRKEEKVAPSDHLEAILREGPRLGLHLILWCDTVSNLNRYFNHQLLREIEMRVLFQMSPTDSGHLLDSPEASKLGENRALFVSEEQNRRERFRPYGFPSDDLLDRIAVPAEA